MAKGSAALGFRDVLSPSSRPVYREETLSSRDVHGLQAPEATIRIEFEDTAPWHTAVAKRLEELLNLPDDWDGYGAAALNPRVLEGAARVLNEVMTEDTVPPAMIPTHEGSLLLEWHRGPRSFEIEVPPSGGRTLVFYFDDESGEEWVDQLRIVRDRIRRLVERVSGDT